MILSLWKNESDAEGKWKQMFLFFFNALFLGPANSLINFYLLWLHYLPPTDKAH